MKAINPVATSVVCAKLSAAAERQGGLFKHVIHDSGMRIDRYHEEPVIYDIPNRNQPRLIHCILKHGGG